MELADIKLSLSELSDDDLRDLLLGIRSNRRVAKKPVASEKKTKIASGTKKDSGPSIDSLLKMLSPEQMMELMKELGGSK